MTLDEKHRDRLKKLDALGKPPQWWQLFKLRAWLRRYRAIMALSLDEMSEALRHLYSTTYVESLANQQHSLLAHLTKKAPATDANADYTTRKARLP